MTTPSPEAGGWGSPPPESPLRQPFPGAELPPGGYGPSEPPLSQPYYDAPFGVAVSRMFSRWNQMAGRSSRAEYWWAYLAIFLANLVAGFVPVLGSLFSLLLLLVTVVPLFTLTARRYHDTNKSAWWMLVPMGGQLLVLTGLALFVAGILAGWSEPISYKGDDAFFLAAGVAGVSGFVLSIWGIVQLAARPQAAGVRFDRE